MVFNVKFYRRFKFCIVCMLQITLSEKKYSQFFVFLSYYIRDI